MRPVVGKSYVTRDGVKVGPAVSSTASDNDCYPWKVGKDKYTANGFYYFVDGNGFQPAHPKDLICEAES